MKTYITILLTIISLGMSFKYLYQPVSLRVSDTMIIQPIIENEDMEMKYQYIRTYKVYYRDLHYCSDSSVISFIPKKGDSLTINSTGRRMSCQILAVFNLTKWDAEWIRYNDIEYIGIYNRVTDNYYRYENPDPQYLKILQIKYQSKLNGY